MRHFFFLLLFPVLFSVSAMAEENYLKHESFILENGMKVIVIPNQKVPAVSHMVWYQVGAIDEVYGKSGLAHFLEHLMFKGTTKFARGVFSETVAKWGGNDNAFTSHDVTAYYQNIAKEKLALVMEMEADRMQNLLFNEDDILRERKIVLEERHMRTDNNPKARLREQMLSALYRNHPYQRPVIGWKDEILSLTAQDAYDFYTRYYHPANAILVVSGDITKAELEPLAERYYGTLKAGQPNPRLYPNEPDIASAMTITLEEDDIKQEEWMRYYLAPSQTTQNSEYCYGLTLLSKILGEGETSYLYKKLVLEEKLASAITTGYDDVSRGPSRFVIAALPAPGISLARLEKAIDKALEAFAAEVITQKELRRHQGHLIDATIYAAEDLKSLAYLYGFVLSSGLEANYVEEWATNIRNVSVKDIKKAARFIWQQHRVTGSVMNGGQS